MGNTTEEEQENGGIWREIRDQKMTMSVIIIIIIIIMIRNRSNKREKEKSSKEIIRQIGKCKCKVNFIL
jgi:hypothetical protein